jgi:hypothetical protein
MPDNLTQRGGQDRVRIDIGQEHELRYWAETLNVSREQLSEAVRAVGDSADAVRKYLKSQPQRDS